jgi:signal transduction histidine kinase
MSQTLILTYFFYGLSFFAMGLAVLLETGRSPALAEARSLRFLAAFGLLHGTHEWLESFLMESEASGAHIADWFSWLRLALLIASFAALFGYAYVTLQLTSLKIGGRRFFHFDRLAVYEVLIILSVVLTYRERPVQWLPALDAMARYLLAVPAAALTGLALYTQARRYRAEGRSALTRPITLAAASFGLYALGQLFVRSIDAFPALYISQEAFLATTGVPIQVIRTVAAIAVTIGLLRAIQLMEKERQAQLVSANQARLEALEERDALRRDLLRHIVRSQEDERARISRELHDEIAQLLSGFSLELAALRTTTRKADIIRMVDHLQGLSRQMSQSLYHLVRDLRPANLDDLGLVPALGSLAAQDCQPRGLRVQFNVTGTQRRLNPLVETVLFRVAQEALNNVCRHAGVKEATLELDYQPEHVLIRIADQGTGFDPTETFRPPRGWGLAGMRERVESLSGELRLRSASGQGTTVEVLVPLSDEAGKEPMNGKSVDIARR